MQDPAVRAKNLHTALLCDVLDQLDRREVFLGPDIRPISPGTVVLGRALTLEAACVEGHTGQPYGELFAAFQAVAKGDVLVIATDGERYSGLWGELLSVAARAQGAAGVVTSGLVRDVDKIAAMEFPVFCSGSSPVDSHGRQDIITYGQPVTFGSTEVRTGDLIVGDAMGVVAVPQDLAAEAVDLAESKAAGEDRVRDDLAAGTEIGEVFRRYGIL